MFSVGESLLLGGLVSRGGNPALGIVSRGGKSYSTRPDDNTIFELFWKVLFAELAIF